MDSGTEGSIANHDMHYLDDFLAFGLPKSPVYLQNLEIIEGVYKHLAPLTMLLHNKLVILYYIGYLHIMDI